MYVYINSYKEVNRVVLLYPSLIDKKEYQKWSLINNEDKNIEIETVRLDEYNNTLEDLRHIILGDNSN